MSYVVDAQLDSDDGAPQTNDPYLVSKCCDLHSTGVSGPGKFLYDIDRGPAATDLCIRLFVLSKALLCPHKVLTQCAFCPVMSISV